MLLNCFPIRKQLSRPITEAVKQPRLGQEVAEIWRDLCGVAGGRNIDTESLPWSEIREGLDLTTMGDLVKLFRKLLVERAKF